MHVSIGMRLLPSGNLIFQVPKYEVTYITAFYRNCILTPSLSLFIFQWDLSEDLSHFYSLIPHPLRNSKETIRSKKRRNRAHLWIFELFIIFVSKTRAKVGLGNWENEHSHPHRRFSLCSPILLESVGMRVITCFCPQLAFSCVLK